MSLAGHYVRTACTTLPSMPKSRVRKTAAYTPPPKRSAKKRRSASWVAPAMVTFLVLGVIWLTLYYVTGGSLWGLRSLPELANLGIGFGFVIIGFGLSTQWR